jgi:hypothetical protein
MLDIPKFGLNEKKIGINNGIFLTVESQRVFIGVCSELFQYKLFGSNHVDLVGAIASCCNRT